MTSLSIKLTKGFIPRVKEGDKILKGQLLAEKSSAGNDHEINIANILNVSIKNAYKYLLKRLGDRVEERTVVAKRKGALGIGGRKAVSPIAGTVFNFDNESAVLTIRSASETKVENLFSPVDGEVVLCDNEKITIKAQKGEIIAKEGVGQGSFDGILQVFSGDEVDPLNLKKIEGKIIAGYAFGREALSKSLGLSVTAIITCELKEEGLDDLKSKLVKTPILIVEDRDYEKISKAKGKKIYIDAEKKTIILQGE